jgi:hypothetical protein
MKLVPSERFVFTQALAKLIKDIHNANDRVAPQLAIGQLLYGQTKPRA